MSNLVTKISNGATITINRHKVVSKLLEEYRNRPRTITINESMERSKEVRQTNHIAACEGFEANEFTEELDHLYINGKITLDEQIELVNLLYL